jgi:adenylate cyclase
VSRTGRRVGRSPARGLALLACACALLCALHRTGRELRFLERLELATLDLRFQQRGPAPVGDAVVIVAIDDETVRAAPELVERRKGWAAVVRAVAANGPAAIGIDGFFPDAERLLTPGLVADIDAYLSGRTDQAPATALLRRTREEAAGDRALAAEIAAAGNVVLALHLDDGRPPLPDDPALVTGTYGQVRASRRAPAAAAGGVVSRPAFNAAARALGAVTVYEDEDHTVRELVFARRVGDEVYMPIEVPLLALRTGATRGETVYLADARRVEVGELEIPLTARDTLLLNFRGPQGTFPQLSASDVVAGRRGAELRGKIALIGVTYFGHDTTRTPFGGGVPGVELHATAIDNALAGDVLARSSPLVDALACLLSGLLVALLFAGRLRLGPGLRVLGILLVAAGDVAAAWLLFTRAHLWHGVVWPLLAAALVGAVGLALAYAGEAVQRVRLRRTFSHYVGAEVLEQLLADPHLLDLGGARRELTVLFSDIREFTALSERLTPEELVGLLNLYLTPMTEAVLQRGGYLDKYIGDAVMAVYGAPVPRAEHAALALATAAAMHAALGRLQPALEARGTPLRIGVGINTGEVVVGNMGSRERFDYTVVGDAVNLASRLEGLTKLYGVFCLVGPGTRAAAPAGYAFRELDLVRVKGKGEAVAVFELLAGDGVTLARYAGQGRWDAAVAAWRRGDLAAARAGFTGFAGDNPDDAAARLYLERLDALAGVDKPPPGWDPVTSLHHK